MIIAPRPQTYWDARAAGNFILGGSGGGLILAAALASAGAERAPSVLVGAALVAAGLLLVWLEIGRPERFLNVFRNPRTSWMSREAWVAALLLPLAVAAFAAPMPLTAYAAAALGGLFLYCQARILKASRGIPAWRPRETVPLIVATGLAEGAGLYLVLGAFGLAGGWRVSPLVAFAAVLFTGARLLAWRLWLKALHRDAPPAAAAVMARLTAPFVLGGHVLPALLGITAWWLPQVAGYMIAAAALLVVLAGWMLKWALVVAAGHTQGFAIEKSPARGRGRAGPGARPGWGRP